MYFITLCYVYVTEYNLHTRFMYIMKIMKILYTQV